MNALAKEGEEGKLRGRYVAQLAEKEELIAGSENVSAETRKRINKANNRYQEIISKLKG